VPFLDHRPYLTPVDESGDRIIWEVIEEVRYHSEKYGVDVVVPKRFRFDGASVPRDLLAWHIAGGRAVSAACLHDWIYETGSLPKDIGDGIFLEAMLDTKVPENIAKLMYLAVVELGASSYRGSVNPVRG
jgi:hypothetical protein